MPLLRLSQILRVGDLLHPFRVAAEADVDLHEGLAGYCTAPAEDVRRVVVALAAPRSLIACPRFCVRMRPSSTIRSCPRSWLCQADRAPASKCRRAMLRSLDSIVTDLPVKRGSSAPW